MDSLPVELLTMIAVDSFDLFTMLLRVPTIGNRLCEQYPQLIAKEKFILAKVTNVGICTYLNGKPHSFNEQPAVVHANSKNWYRYGKRHRDADMPAIDCASGDKYWYWNGQQHRENDLPAIDCASGDKYWYWNGQQHRENDKPAVECATSGTKVWYIHGKWTH
jgi:hypothetical protein